MNKLHSYMFKYGWLFVLMLLFPFCIYGKDLTSTSFIVRDPIIGTGGEYGSSASFKLFSAGDTLLTGVGSSATYIGRYGFLYYPYVITDTLVATPGVAKVDLSWVASTAGLGFSVSGYKTGIASISGGPYLYTTVGNVSTYSYTSLAPGQYCFVLQTLDAFSNVIGTSNESCVTVQPSLSFAISANSVQFGSLSSASPRYATTSGGSASNTIAHTITAASGAPSGYTLSYSGALPTSGSNTITQATITSSATGSPGTNQFATSLSTSGSATIQTAYQQSSPNWSFVPGAVTPVASTAGVTSSETFSVRYLANISNITPAGEYMTNVTYLLTGNF